MNADLGWHLGVAAQGSHRALGQNKPLCERRHRGRDFDGGEMSEWLHCPGCGGEGRVAQYASGHAAQDAGTPGAPFLMRTPGV
jgi:hypothetical protein